MRQKSLPIDSGKAVHVRNVAHRDLIKRTAQTGIVNRLKIAVFVDLDRRQVTQSGRRPWSLLSGSRVPPAE
jgi:hypothetical protein